MSFLKIERPERTEDFPDPVDYAAGRAIVHLLIYVPGVLALLAMGLLLAEAVHP